jgi:hypothetical protein
MGTVKERFCAQCGESLGFIENRHYESGDTCGKLQCQRDARDAASAEREDAHRELDERMGWD